MIVFCAAILIAHESSIFDAITFGQAVVQTAGRSPE
jgi:hypothetical protein